MHVDFSAFDLDPQTRQLLRQERFEFEAVLGTAVRFTTSPVRGPQWVAVQDDDAMPSLSWDPDTPTLTSRARDQAQLMSTLQLLQTLAHSRTHHVEAVPAPSVDGATDMLHTEVANTFTSLRLRGLDWEAITCTALGSAPTTWGGDFRQWAPTWVARLGDAHTTLIDHRMPTHNPPYTAELVGREARFLIVPQRAQPTPQACAGVDSDGGGTRPLAENHWRLPSTARARGCAALPGSAGQ